MNETGRYPGQAWLWLYTMWCQIPPFNSATGFLGITTANADLAVVGVTRRRGHLSDQLRPDNAGFDAEPTALDKIYALWDEMLASRPITKPRQRSHIHFVLGRLSRIRDAYAVRGLINRLDIMQMTPKNAINYLLAVAADNHAVCEVML